LPLAGGETYAPRFSRPAPGPTTVAAALRAAHVPYGDGELLSAGRRRVLDAHYRPTRVLRNGRVVSLTDVVSPGDRLEVRPGRTSLEATRQVLVALPTPAGPPIEFDLLSPGHGGVAAQLVGVHSGEVVRSRFVRPVSAPARERRPLVALTFDDGPDPTWTPQVLAILRQQHVRATFCLVGRLARKHPELVRQIVAAGHVLCNHTEHHVMHLDVAPRALVRDEIAHAQQALRAAVGRGARVFRAPYGAVSRVVVAEATRLHLRVVLWDVDPEDWRRPPAAAIVRRVLTGVRPGSVVLMHDGGGDRRATVAALPSVIAGLRARHFGFAVP
jgi:peptidoglycan/xylan/chitin deacetylase (PgdA/CDA1 family)